LFTFTVTRNGTDIRRRVCPESAESILTRTKDRALSQRCALCTLDKTKSIIVVLATKRIGRLALRSDPAVVKRPANHRRKNGGATQQSL